MILSEKNEMVEEAHRIIKNIKQMETSLDDSKARHELDFDDQALKVTYPLTRCLQVLKEKHNSIAKIHRERFEQVKSGYINLPCSRPSLTRCRARRGAGVIFVPPRTIFRQNLAAADVVDLVNPNHFRSFAHLCHSSRP